LETETGPSGRSLHIRRSVELFESAITRVPVVVGHFRPAILLPVSALTGLTADQLEAILAHELAHIRRYDYLVNLLQTLMETLLFYHPAVWWISRKIRIERENCCDDLAVAVCGNRLTYAQALLTMETLRQPQLKFALAASGGSLLDRIRRLIDPTYRSSSQRAVSLSVAVVLLAIFALLIGFYVFYHHSAARDNFFDNINEKVAKLDINKATRDDVIKVFGEPTSYRWDSKTFDKDNLPDRYVMIYYDKFMAFIANDSIVELRFHQPGPYTFRNTLRVGSTLEEALKVLGQPIETVVGQKNQFNEGVLYKDIEGTPGRHYYARPNQGVRLFFFNNKINGLFSPTPNRERTSAPAGNDTPPRVHHREMA
jgi:hypothetical protein